MAELFTAADIIKPTAKKTISGLKQLDIEVVMITGDHKKVGEAVGVELDI